MTDNKVVARFQDGRIVKGRTCNFVPTKPVFHLTPNGAEARSRPLEIQVAQLKAVFFVKDFDSAPHANPHPLEFDPRQAAPGRRIRVVFKDGETLLGTTQGYDPTRTGFFVIPSDAASNNERCFVVMASTREVAFL
jgi:hypothetical protein